MSIYIWGQFCDRVASLSKKRPIYTLETVNPSYPNANRRFHHDMFEEDDGNDGGCDELPRSLHVGRT